MVTYLCRRCGTQLDPRAGQQVSQFSREAGRVFVIRCPKCKTDNRFKGKIESGMPRKSGCLWMSAAPVGLALLVLFIAVVRRSF
jgi:DNA-directed RNA polymerase subunit RPC12/RpoP